MTFDELIRRIKAAIHNAQNEEVNDTGSYKYYYIYEECYSIVDMLYNKYKDTLYENNSTSGEEVVRKDDNL